MTHHFYLEEAGYKGTLQDTPQANDLCLVAGLLIRESDEANVLSKLDTIFKETNTEKLSSTLIAFIQQEQALQIFHGAAYCTGLYKDRIAIQSLVDAHKSIYHIPLTDVIMKIDEFMGEAGETLAFITGSNNGSIAKESIHFIPPAAGDKGILKDIDGADLELDYILSLSFEYKHSVFTQAAALVTAMIYQHLQHKVEQGFDKGLNGDLVFEDFALAAKIIYLDDQSVFDKLYSRE